MHPFTDKLLCNGVQFFPPLARLHSSSALLEVSEAGSDIRPPSGPQESLPGGRGAGRLHSTRESDVKMERGENQQECVRSCVSGPLRLAWLGVPGHRYRVTGSEARVQAVRRFTRGFQRSEPRCTLMLGERCCLWFAAGLKYPSPSSCRLHE